MCRLDRITECSYCQDVMTRLTTICHCGTEGCTNKLWTIQRSAVCYKCEKEDREVREIETLLVDMTKRGEFYDISDGYFPISQKAAIFADNGGVKSSKLTTTCILRTVYKCTNCEQLARIQDEVVQCYKGSIIIAIRPSFISYHPGTNNNCFCIFSSIARQT